MGFVLRAATLRQQLEGGADARRLVDGNLLRDRQVHRQVQEGIALALLDRVIGGDGGLDVAQAVVIFRMLHDPVAGDGFQRREDFMALLLAIGFAEEAADIVLGRREHGGAQFGDKALFYAGLPGLSGGPGRPAPQRPQMK